MIVDLGDLPVATTGVVKLRLINDEQSSFSVDDIELACNCTSATISDRAIKPGSDVTLELSMKTEARAKSQQMRQSVNLVSKSDPSKNISLVIQFNLSGLLTFVGQSYAIDVDSSLDRQIALIPILLTKPVMMKNVALEVIPRSEGVIATLEEKGGSHHAVVTFDPALVPDHSLAISIVARDATRGLEDTVPLLLCKRKELEITPRTIRFKIDKDGLIATCLLRYRPSSDEQPSSPLPVADTNENVNVEAVVGAKPLQVETKKLGRGIYRITLRDGGAFLKDVEADDQSPQITWRVMGSKKSNTLTSDVLLDPSPL